MATIYRIECMRGHEDHEVYYEPRNLTATERNILRSHGWTVRARRVDSDAEIARLNRRADDLAYQAADLAGASSATHTCRLCSALARQKAQEAERAARGEGNLTS